MMTRITSQPRPAGSTQDDATAIPVTDAAVLSSVAQLLYREAALLDEWRLDEWLALMHPQVTYRVPTPGYEQADPAATLQVIHDDRALLAGRITRLKSKHAHAESPKSHTRRLVTNIRADSRPDGTLTIYSNFHIMRTRMGKLDHFIGHYRHLLVPDQGNSPVGYLIRERTATLDHGIVEAGGTVSILL
jgi:p-cumate 2,3-dioxygenase beta subunit